MKARSQSQRGQSTLYYNNDYYLDGFHIGRQRIGPYHSKENAYPINKVKSHHNLKDIDHQLSIFSESPFKELTNKLNNNHKVQNPQDLNKHPLPLSHQSSSFFANLLCKNDSTSSQMVTDAKYQQQIHNTKKRKRDQYECKKISEQNCIDQQYENSTNDTSSFDKDFQTFKKRKLNNKDQFLMLRLSSDKRMKRPFKIYQDSQIFKCANKKLKKIIGQLIDHKVDNDWETDSDTVEEHKQRCTEDLNEGINAFLEGDPLKECRNLRNNFSGINGNYLSEESEEEEDQSKSSLNSNEEEETSDI